MRDYFAHLFFMRKLDLTGKKFGRLTAIKDAGKTNSGMTKWLCKCECGNENTVAIGALRSGLVRSCGCYKLEVTKRVKTIHGQSGRTSEYCAWQSMKSRCTDPGNKDYKHYGGRGIKVCPRWLNSFLAFFEDMGPKPSKKHSLDRINNETGHYKKSNCRWAIKKVQVGNTRRNRWIEHNGTKMIIADWSRHIGISQDRLRGFINRGKTMGDVILLVETTRTEPALP